MINARFCIISVHRTRIQLNKSITDKLWNTNISSKKMEDAKIKKLIANINIGLLEKNTNKAQKSLVFDTLSEAIYHQQTLGGTINALSGRDDDFKECDLENLDESEEEETPNENTNEINNYYILTIKDKKDLTNGFRYIKELLLQIHNFRMYQDYYKLVEAGIHVNYVKTDAFLLKN